MFLFSMKLAIFCETRMHFALKNDGRAGYFGALLIGGDAGHDFVSVETSRGTVPGGQKKGGSGRETRAGSHANPVRTRQDKSSVEQPQTSVPFRRPIEQMADPADLRRSR